MLNEVKHLANVSRKVYCEILRFAQDDKTDYFAASRTMACICSYCSSMLVRSLY